MRRLSGLISLILCLGLVPCVAFALGLGNIHLHSALGQKLDADIAIVGNQSVDGLKVELASPEQFKKAGVDRSAVLRTLKFEIVHRDDGYGIHVSSSEPVREPFLTFLVSAEWPSGQVLREYTVLLDPPNYAAAPPAAGVPAAAATPAPRPAASAPTTQPSPVRHAATVASAPSAGPLRAGDNYGTIQRGDTLWGIARELRVGTDIGIDQMMIALYRANPRAFSGNINRMKAGYTLRVPDAASIRNIDRRSAIAAVMRANREFAASRVQSMPKATVATADTTASAGATGTHLQLVAPGSDTADESGAAPGTAATTAAVADLKQQLAQARQQADDAAKKTAALAGEVDDLKQQLAENKRLLAVKDKQLSQLQSRVRKQQAAAPASTQPQAGGAFDWIAFATKPMVLAGVLVVIVLILGILVVLRRRNTAAGADAVTITPIAEPAADEAGDEAAVSEAAADDAAAAEPAETDERNAEDEDATMVSAALPAVEEPVGIELPGSDDAQPSDPIAEADFHLDYGLYDQAAEIIRKAIEAHPERDELFIKLFKIYFAAGDTTAFPVAAQEFADWGADHPAEWDEICAMGRELVPQEPLFAAGFLDPEAGGEAAGTTTETGVETATDIAVDEDTEIEDPREQALDLDLESLGLGDTADTGTETAAAEASSDAGAETVPGSGTDESDGAFDLSDLTMPSEATGGDRLVDTQTEFEDAIKELSEFVDTNFPEEGDGAKGAAPVEPGSGGDALAAGTEAEGDDFGDGYGLDELDTKLDLARAYMDMGDPEGARSILEEVIEEGGPDHQSQARSLLERVG